MRRSAAIVALLLGLLLAGCPPPTPPPPRGQPTGPLDPVCGMTVDTSGATAPITTALDGVTYHFCSGHCLDRFAADPGRFRGAR